MVQPVEIALKSVLELGWSVSRAAVRISPGLPKAVFRVAGCTAAGYREARSWLQCQPAWGASGARAGITGCPPTRA
jgi:hypothetical protein